MGGFEKGRRLEAVLSCWDLVKEVMRLWFLLCDAIVSNEFSDDWGSGKIGGQYLPSVFLLGWIYEKMQERLSPDP